jgi:hypothetical protein
MRIKVMPDYECSPLWWDEPDRVGNIRPEELGLSETLAADVWAWAAIFDAALNDEEPRFSDFLSEAEREDFDEKGRLLTARIAAELGSTASVRFVG